MGKTMAVGVGCRQKGTLKGNRNPPKGNGNGSGAVSNPEMKHGDGPNVSVRYLKHGDGPNVSCLVFARATEHGDSETPGLTGTHRDGP